MSTIKHLLMSRYEAILIRFNNLAEHTQFLTILENVLGEQWDTNFLDFNTDKQFIISFPIKENQFKSATIIKQDDILYYYIQSSLNLIPQIYNMKDTDQIKFILQSIRDDKIELLDND